MISRDSERRSDQTRAKEEEERMRASATEQERNFACEKATTVLFKADPAFWTLSFCSDNEIRNLQHYADTSSKRNEAKDFEKSEQKPLFATLAELCVCAFALQEVVRQLEFFDRSGGDHAVGRSSSSTTDDYDTVKKEKKKDSVEVYEQAKITLADLIEICDEAVITAYEQAKKLKLRRTNYEANKQPVRYPKYEQIWHKPEINEPFKLVIADETKVKGKHVFEILTRRNETQRFTRERNKVLKNVFYWRGGVPQFEKRKKLQMEEMKQSARAKLDPTGEIQPPKSVFEDETELARALTRVENDPRTFASVSKAESKAEEVRTMYLEEHERTWNDMLTHALMRFDVFVTTAKYNELLHLKYKKTKDGKEVLIIPKKKGMFSRYGCEDFCIIM